MKNIYYYLMIGAVTATTFFSCNNSDELSVNEEPVNINQEDDLIARNILNISSDDAFKLAKRFYKDEYAKESRTASTVNVKDIQTVTSESGEPLMYIVNYADNKGYTIISATKNYTPVLAYSETGNMDAQNSTFLVNPFFNEYKSRIESVVNVESDSLRQRYALDWSFYETEAEIVNSRLYTNEQIQQELTNARTYYTNQGYEVHSLGAATSLIPAGNGQTAEQRANGFINDICNHTPPQYDCMDVNLLLVKRTNEEFGPFINTEWYQGAPYCGNSPNGLAGCATIAVMQMMYHYKHPNSIPWNYIPDNWVTNYLNQYTIDFANNIRNALNPGYKENSTSFAEGCIKSALDNNTYRYNVEEKDYDKGLVEFYMRNGKPIITYGAKPNSSYCHYWIYDGYKSNRVQYAAYMINADFEYYTFFTGMTDIVSEYFHANIGSGYNAWFYQDTISFGGDSFSANREIHVLTPR